MPTQSGQFLRSGIAPTVLVLLYGGLGIALLVAPTDVSAALRARTLDSDEIFYLPWRMLGLEMLGVSLVVSRQVVDPHRGVFLGVTGFCVMVTLLSGAAAATEIGWKRDAAYFSALLHGILSMLSLRGMTLLPDAVAEPGSPTFVLMLQTALLFVVGLDYALQSKSAIARMIRSEPVDLSVTKSDIITLASAVFLWGVLKACTAMITMTLAHNAKKWDLWTLGAYGWMMMAGVGLFLVNIGAQLFDEWEAYAMLAVNGSLAAYFVFSALTYSDGEDVATSGPPADTDEHSHQD